MDLLALADDLTGALEVAAKFAGIGSHAVVSTGQGQELEQFAAGRDAVVVDAHSRHLPPADAFKRVRTLAEAARRLGVQQLYKKTDSTLRGNIAAEFQALLEVYPDRPLVYVPAYPEFGRTVRDGLLYVNGKPLSRTEFRADALNPSRESSILKLLSGSGAARVMLARAAAELHTILTAGEAGSIIVCDGESSDDLRATADALAGHHGVVAGTGGFAGLWAATRIAHRPPAAFPHASRWLLVAGSRHPISLEQLAVAERNGLAVARLGAAPDSDKDAVEHLAACLAQRGWAAVAPPQAADLPALEIAARLGQTVARLLERGTTGGLIVFGGDTASAILSALQVSRVHACGELLPGIPLSLVNIEAGVHAGASGGRTGGLPCPKVVLVTKAGGFGAPDLIARLRERLESAT